MLSALTETDLICDVIWRETVTKEWMRESVVTTCGEREMHSTGVEPVTLGSEDRCSIQLSYECREARLWRVRRCFQLRSDFHEDLAEAVVAFPAAGRTDAPDLIIPGVAFFKF